MIEEIDIDIIVHWRLCFWCLRARTRSYHLFSNLCPVFSAHFPVASLSPPLHPQLASLAVNYGWCWCWCWCWWREMNNNGQIICR